MSQENGQYCPICQVAVATNPRYPHFVCSDCASRAADKNGRSLDFSNEGFSGGFIAKYSDTGEEFDSHLCFIDGIRCWADEARFGGIVIQTIKHEA